MYYSAVYSFLFQWCLVVGNFFLLIILFSVEKRSDSAIVITMMFGLSIWIRAIWNIYAFKANVETAKRVGKTYLWWEPVR